MFNVRLPAKLIILQGLAYNFYTCISEYYSLANSLDTFQPVNVSVRTQNLHKRGILGRTRSSRSLSAMTFIIRATMTEISDPLE